MNRVCAKCEYADAAVEHGGCTGWRFGWKMINLSVTDRAGQSGSRERGPDGKVKRSVRDLRDLRGLWGEIRRIQ